MKRMRNARAQSGERRFERVARERVRVLVWLQPFAEPHHRDAVDRGHQNPEHRVGLRARREQSPASMTLWMCAAIVHLHLANETETLPVLG